MCNYSTAKFNIFSDVSKGITLRYWLLFVLKIVGYHLHFLYYLNGIPYINKSKEGVRLVALIPSGYVKLNNTQYIYFYRVANNNVLLVVFISY